MKKALDLAQRQRQELRGQIRETDPNLIRRLGWGVEKKNSEQRGNNILLRFLAPESKIRNLC
jgi:hypothetical protein